MMLIRTIEDDPENTVAVLIDPEGKESDSWDPVYAVIETDSHWKIETVSYTYEEPKRPGYRLVVRKIEAR